MAIPSTPRLDNLAAMQSRPLGTNTALYRDPSTEAVGRQYRQQKSDYNLARRMLRRQARKGDVKATIGMIDLGERAAGAGVTVGGGLNSDETKAAIAGRTAGMKQETTDMTNAATTNRGLASGRPAMGEPPPMLARPEEPKSVWNTPATTELGGRAYEELGKRGPEGGNDLNFRQGLDRAIGMAKTDQERNELGMVAKEAGISDEAFKRRADWWNKKRR